jgi:hypothetical protein
MGGKVVQVATFNVRQKYTYFESFEVEAEDAEEAIQLVNDGEADGNGLEYHDTEALYLLDEDELMPAEEQPDNAFGY